MIAIAAVAESVESADALPREFSNIMSNAINKKTTAKPKVIHEIIFSDPLSLVLAKTLRPPPVMAPEAPSDLPP